MPEKTLFKYKCSCGRVDYLRVEGRAARCKHCKATYPVSPTGVIRFSQITNEQNAYFDAMYGAGYSTAKDQVQQDADGAFRFAKEGAEAHLKSAQLDIAAHPLENLRILDAACGSGWVTAGLLKNPNTRNCELHAFDISPDGLEMLARYSAGIQSANRLEMSVQSAEAMMFSNGTFDIIIGSSILHHFDTFETFLVDCHRILKPGGIAIFGEPFAIGYGLGAAALMIAESQLGVHHQIVQDFYDDLAFRNKATRELLQARVDKHLFFQSKFIPLAQQIGFSSVDFVLPQSPEHLRQNFITGLLQEWKVSDIPLAERATAVYQTIFDLFDPDSLAHSMGAFVHIVLRR